MSRYAPRPAEHELDRAVNEALVLGLTTTTGLHSYLARSSRRPGAHALGEALRGACLAYRAA